MPTCQILAKSLSIYKIFKQDVDDHNDYYVANHDGSLLSYSWRE